MNHARCGDEGDVVAFAFDVGLSKGDGVVFFGGHHALEGIHHFVFVNDDGVVISNGGFEEALGVGGCGGNGDFEAGDVREPGV